MSCQREKNSNFAAMQQEFASRLLEEAVTELSRLPGIGRKTALRLALHLLRADEQVGVALGPGLRSFSLQEAEVKADTHN